ncbi:elongation of very long chain fatty acids protein 7-like isoform X2 [Pectinophora gossypiella]|uniref:elongation of very long chain fatty acids protein 7-like isoform X2 n=1 Tax=Pectinophora gossypiella TaxID=13191 RepID=UPI00214E58E4|nr:elongation of very long chain fatty acids protein 7-like isoform X2 [Pectinophora gossypiella]
MEIKSQDIDPRTKTWFLVAKPYQGLALLGLYLMFVLKWGPEWMKDRKPFNLNKILIVYNAAQVAACMYLFVNAIRYAWGWNYKWVCEPCNQSDDPDALRIAKLVNFYFMLKVVDLLDTVFFILRKKFNQVSFLHVYHHTGMVMLVWGAVTYLPGGHGTFIGVINAFVHVVMYSYYLLTVAMPSVKGSLWWKKYITQLQILQFFWCVVHMSLIVFKPDCAYPRWTAAVFLPQNLFMLILFIDFYIRAYIKKPQVKPEVKDSNGKENGHKKDVTNGRGNGHKNGYTNDNTNDHKNGHKNGNGIKNGSSKKSTTESKKTFNGHEKVH